MTHTKEPWRFISDGNDEYSIMPGGDWYIATTHDGVFGEPTAEANARRIVACVNACAGIPLERLEQVPPINAAKDWVDTVLQWKDQRDEYRNTVEQQAELLAAHKAELQDWQRAMLKAQQERDELLAALVAAAERERCAKACEAERDRILSKQS